MIVVDLFNENSLRVDISKTWGEHGAHIDVFDMMLKALEKVRNPEAGFGIPFNIRKEAPIHWWTPSDKKACDPSGLTMHFAGDRIVSIEQLEERGVCMRCLTEVLKAAEILGHPVDLPEELKVRVR
jgi:hypothetical protein